MNAQAVALDLPAINHRHHAMTRFLLSRLESNLDVHLRLHGAVEPFTGRGGIVVANHFTRLETFVIPFVLYRELGLILRVLAAPMFFTNKVVGHYLFGIGALPANYPNKYERIARDILHGGWWLIFPEGSMVKDRKVIERGRLLVKNETGTVKRRPHSGSAIIALTVQRYKAALRHALETGTDLDAICQTLALPAERRDEIEQIAYQPTPIVPLNVTYYPLNPQENFLKSLATRLAPKLVQSNMGERLLEELTVEGSMLLAGVEVDMRLGQPLMVEARTSWYEGRQMAPWSSSPWRRCLDRLRAWRLGGRYTALLDGWAALHGQHQRRRAWAITQAYMRSIYDLTTVNADHLLSGLLFLLFQKHRQDRYGGSELKQRLYLTVEFLRRHAHVHLHPSLDDPELHSRLLTDQPHSGVDHFIQRAIDSGLFTCHDKTWYLASDRLTDRWPFGAVRLQNFMQVCYNEIEPLADVMQALQDAVRVDLRRQQQPFADALFAYEQHLYEQDYAAYTSAAYAKLCPLRYEVGRPVLLRQPGTVGTIGVLLVHGYSASPGEVLPLAHYLHTQGFTVYAVRLRGHGTSPYDLRQRSWQEWCDSVVRGYYSLRAISEVQFVGGMSTGGALALYLAAQQLGPLQGIFAVGAPIKLHNRYLRLVPVAKAMRDFVRAEPENPTTNYTHQPLQAVWQLTQFIEAYQKVLPGITLPTLLIQARGDTTVRPESAQMIYDQLPSTQKQLLWKDIDRHVIIGEDYPEIQRDIGDFIRQYAPVAVSHRQ